MRKIVMFTFISPKNDEFHQNSIHLFHQAFENNQNLTPFFQDVLEATYLLENDKEEGYVGGALLMKKKLFPFLRTLGNQKITFPTQEKEIWVSTIGLNIKNPTFDFEAKGKIFYKRLYQELVNFGALHKVNFLYLLLDPGEYLCTEALGFWPYVIEIRPQDSLDGLFHGLLSLKKEFPTHKQPLQKPMMTTHRLAA